MNHTKYICVFVTCFIICHVNGQAPNDIRYINTDALVTGILFRFQSNACGTVPYDIGHTCKIRLVRDLGDSKYLIDVLRNNANQNTGDNFAQENIQYCVSHSDYRGNFQNCEFNPTRTAFGFLAVPFKLRFNPTTVAPGGELGGFYGWFIGDTRWLVAAHAGLTFVSLNDINAATPENKTGFTFGFTIINDISDVFQVGFVSGIDLFDGVDTWEYGYQPWLSVQFGFKFTKSE